MQHGDANNTIKLTLGERNGQAFLGIRPYADATVDVAVNAEKGSGDSPREQVCRFSAAQCQDFTLAPPTATRRQRDYCGGEWPNH